MLNAFKNKHCSNLPAIPRSYWNRGKRSGMYLHVSRAGRFRGSKSEPGKDQRLIMIAAQFRKEVTSTVLWLLRHSRAMLQSDAVSLDHEFLLNLEQVIPLPEAEDLMIGITEKEKEEY